MVYLTNIINDDLRNWNPHSQIFIAAPTGSGKTQFILRKLLPYVIKNGREILYLSNRVLLHKQIVKEVCSLQNVPYELLENQKIAELSGITCLTYQTLQEMNDWGTIINQFFHYVVLDEVHYITEDSLFNPKIQRFLDWLEWRKNCFVTIAISATIEPVLGYLGFYNSEWQLVYEDENKEHYLRRAHDIVLRLKGIPEELIFYHMERTMPQFKVYIYETVNELAQIISEDISEDKWLVFQSNKEKAASQLLRNLNGNAFLLTADNKECEEMQRIVERNQFRSKVLVTTKVLDNGISLHDKKLKNVALETISQTEFIQMLGRRRIEEGEDIALNVYIPKLSANYLKNLVFNTLAPMLKLAELSEKEVLTEIMNDEEAYQRAKMLYDVKDGKLLLNTIAVNMLKKRRQFAEKMALELENNANAFVEQQLQWLGVQELEGTVIYLRDVNNRKNEEKLRKMILSYAGRSLDSEEQKKFRNEVKEILVQLFPEKFPHKNRIPGLKMINEVLEELKFGFCIESSHGKRKGEKTIWKIKNLPRYV
ncbi:hypothetical protein C818_02274 [Lachnospiraceae bacterium MD308]|nr:hypothetical protein C818_02274 [Lachnospiraceae bacterium MD308]